MMHKSRIAFCLPYPLAMRGGVSVLVEELIRSFGEKNEVYLVSPDTSQEVGAHPLKHFIQRHIPIPLDTKPDLNQLADDLASCDIEVVHIHCGGVYGWGNRLPMCSLPHFLSKHQIPCIWTSHLVVSPLDGFCGPQKPIWFKIALFPLAWLGKISQLWSVYREVAVSDHDATKLNRWYFPMRGRFVKIYHSILSETSPEVQIEMMKRDQVVLSVGHVAFRKGQHVLAEAFAQISHEFPNWRLDIAGHDSGDGCWQRIEIIRETEGLQKKISLLGAREDAKALMSRAQVFVQPSRWEALGLALQEAIACGCSTIGTKAGGIPELIVEGQNGLLVRPDDPIGLAEALRSLIQDPIKRQRFSKAGPPSIQEKGMTQRMMSANYKKLYDQASGFGHKAA